MFSKPHVLSGISYFQQMFKCVSKHPYIKLTRIPFLNTLNILSPPYAISDSREMK